MAAMTLASCGGNSKNSESADGDTLIFEETEVVAVDSAGNAIAVTEGAEGVVAAESEGQSIIDQLKGATTAEQAKELAAKAQAYIQQLIASGKIEQAKAYMAQVEPYIKDKAPKAYESMKNLVSSDKLDNLKEKASDLKDAAGDKAEELKDKAAEKADAAKEKASETAEKTKDALKNALGK